MPNPTMATTEALVQTLNRFGVKNAGFKQAKMAATISRTNPMYEERNKPDKVQLVPLWIAALGFLICNGRPSNVNLPAVIFRNPNSASINSELPLPISPPNARTSPLRRENETSPTMSFASRIVSPGVRCGRVNWTNSRPTITATTCCSVVSVRFMVWTCRPSRKTVIRSETEKTSVNRCETHMTATPPAESDFTISRSELLRARPRRPSAHP